MLPKKSTVHPEGPLARAIETLERLGCREEVGEIKRLLVERIQFREEAAAVRSDLAAIRQEAAAMTERAREQRRVARECLGHWRNLALLQQSREELAKTDGFLRSHSWLRADPAA